MKVSKILISLLIGFGSFSVNSQDSSNQTKKDETQKSVVIVQSEEKKQERTSNTQLLSEFGDQKKTFTKKEIEIKNLPNGDANENISLVDKFMNLKTREKQIVIVTIIICLVVCFGFIRYFLTGKQ